MQRDNIQVRDGEKIEPREWFGKNLEVINI